MARCRSQLSQLQTPFFLFTRSIVCIGNKQVMEGRICSLMRDPLATWGWISKRRLYFNEPVNKRTMCVCIFDASCFGQKQRTREICLKKLKMNTRQQMNLFILMNQDSYSCFCHAWKTLFVSVCVICFTPWLMELLWEEQRKKNPLESRLC